MFYNKLSMQQKQSMDSQIFQTNHKEIIEKDHQWKDQELYPEVDQQLTCWERFKIGLNNFTNRSIDYLEFDRIFFLEGDQKIDLKKCHKKFLQDYLQTYSERQLRFGYSFDYVLDQKIKEQKRKEKSFCQELYRFICCEGGNEMNQIDQYYKSEREFEQLLKKKIMARKEEYEEEKKKEQGKQTQKFSEEEQQRQNLKRNRIVTTQNQIIYNKSEEEQPYGDIAVQNLQYYEETVGTKKEKKKKQAEKKQLITEILQVRRNQKQDEDNIFDYQNDFVQQKISGRKEKGEKQPSKPTTHQNSEFQFQSQQISRKNQIARLKGTSSQSILTTNKNQLTNSNDTYSNNSTVITKNIYKQNIITTTTYHDNIIKRNREVNEDGENYSEQNQYNPKKTRKYGRRNEEIQLEDEFEEDQVKISHKRKVQNNMKQQDMPQSNSKKNSIYIQNDNNLQLQRSPKLQNQQLLFTSPRNQQNTVNQIENALLMNKSKKNRQLKEQLQLVEQNQNVAAKKKSKKNRQADFLPQQELQQNYTSKPRTKNEQEQPSIELGRNSKQAKRQQNGQIRNERNYQTIDQPKAAKEIKMKKSRNTSNHNLKITQTTHNYDNPQENVEPISATHNVEPDLEEYSAAKKRRKYKKQLRNQDQSLSNEIDLNNLTGTSASTVQVALARTKSPNNREADQNEDQQLGQAAKKRKVKKQLKEKPSEQAFEMVFLDNFEDNQKGNRKTIQESGNSIFFNDIEEQVQSAVKAEKKRKKPKARKQAAQQDFEEVVNIDF